MEKARQKKNEVHDVITTYQTITRDQMRQIVDNHRERDTVMRICNELFTLRDYINEQMSVISKRYTCVTPRIQDNWWIINAKG